MKELEKQFGPILESIIISRKVEDVIPFAYQIMALLMSNHPTIPELYYKLFDHTCNTSGTDANAAVPFLTVFMAKTNMFSQQQRLSTLLQQIRKLLSDGSTMTWGIHIADAVLRNEAISENHEVAVQVFKIILSTLMANSKRFVQKDFCRLLVNFIIKFKAQKLRIITNQVEQGFYIKCTQVIRDFSEELPTFRDRRRFIHALISLIADPATVKESPQDWVKMVEKCITLLEARMNVDRETDRLDILKATGKSTTSATTMLCISIPFLREQIPSIIELKKLLARSIQHLNTQLPRVVNQNLFRQFEKKYQLSVADYLQATGLHIS